MDLDDEDEDARRSPRRSGAGFSWFRLLLVVRMTTWVALFLAVGCGGLLYCAALGRRDNTVIMEAALGATFSTIFIGLYILTRCIDQLLDGVDKFRSK